MKGSNRLVYSGLTQRARAVVQKKGAFSPSPARKTPPGTEKQCSSNGGAATGIHNVAFSFEGKQVMLAERRDIQALYRNKTAVATFHRKKAFANCACEEATYMRKCMTVQTNIARPLLFTDSKYPLVKTAIDSATRLGVLRRISLLRASEGKAYKTTQHATCQRGGNAQATSV
ncbi:hypothetical protein cyc_01425 [Cyclospora cayetanensis]|uniref:Uncharacterized protein n=1 Tax=Cyclospora cayetanensis TaxID=88456 RepID=A0A1D3D8N2_9EIME|nr:hypothetical protein cyc_01425 [Cyclospora cayetanensis]